MATHKLIISGFGGQGVMLMGKLLAYAGMNEGKAVTWLPSYGPEMRGGTANCHVIVSDEEISSPIISKATGVVVMNLPSLAKFEGNVMPKGDLFINRSLIKDKTSRVDVNTLNVDANEIAEEVFVSKSANVVMIGAIVKRTGIVSMDAMEDAIQKNFGKYGEEVVEKNIISLHRGAEAVK